jgi:hypothetical protein
MFYRIRNNKLYDYSDRYYSDDCLSTNIITQAQLAKDLTQVIVVDGQLELNPEWEYEQFLKAKQDKYNEANTEAKAFLESGNALYEFEEGKHVEATDGNIGKFTGYAVGYITGKLQPTDTVDWNTKEDETVFLTQEQVGDILDGLGKVQGYVWTVQFPAYVQAIQAAQTIEEVQAIRIRYKSSPEEVIEDEVPEPVAEETPEEPEVPEVEVESSEDGELEEEDFILPFESEEPENE